VKIAVDPWTLAGRFRCQGTYVYTQNLLREFKKLACNGSGVTFSLFASDRNGNDAAAIPPAENFEVCLTPLVDYDRVWRWGGAGLSAARANADVMFIPTAATLPVGPVPAVCTIHDVTPLVMPSHSRGVRAMQRLVLKGCARRARAIITSSECSRRDMVTLLGVPPEKITVIYDACDHEIFNPLPADPAALEQLRKKLRIGKPYVLHHGTIQPRKNLKRLIEAFRLMLARDSDLDLDLVLAGPMGWGYDEVINAAASRNGSRGAVIFAGMLPDAELALLIKGAILVAIPSLYEGFSLPMVEAMACGTPTIASSTSCLPEISGQTLAYFDPLSVDDIAACMHSALVDPDLNRRLRQDGIARAREFSWERCARETLDVLTKVGKAAGN
jgi:glycosyltransferase involved in cell wall biosynthesis